MSAGRKVRRRYIRARGRAAKQAEQPSALQVRDVRDPLQQMSLVSASRALLLSQAAAGCRQLRVHSPPHKPGRIGAGRRILHFAASQALDAATVNAEIDGFLRMVRMGAIFSTFFKCAKFSESSARPLFWMNL